MSGSCWQRAEKKGSRGHLARMCGERSGKKSFFFGGGKGGGEDEVGGNAFFRSFFYFFLGGCGLWKKWGDLGVLGN